MSFFKLTFYSFSVIKRLLRRSNLEFILSCPVIIKVLSILTGIILLNILFKNLLVSVVIGTVILGLWSGHPISALGQIAWMRFSSPDNLLLLLIIFLVIWLSTQMSRTGVMKDLVKTVQSQVPRRLAFAALPAVIGLLPMPGGAIFSAPLVDSCDPKGEIPGILKTQTNYWFRHIWEYWWPLYPGVILVLDLTGLEIWQFMLIQIPLTLTAVAVGYLFMLRKIPATTETRDSLEKEDRKSFLMLILPILTVIIIYMLIRFLCPVIVEACKYLPMVIGLSVSLVVLQFQRKSSLREWLSVILSKKAMLMALLIAVIRIYGAVIESPLPDNTFIVELMRMEFSRFGIPLLAVMMFIPFITGLSMGVSVGFVGASFPIVLNLIQPNPTLGKLLATIVLAYGCGFMGMMLSPVHVCLFITCEYFKTRLPHCLYKLIAPAIIVILSAFLLSRVIGWIFIY